MTEIIINKFAKPEFPVKYTNANTDTYAVNKWIQEYYNGPYKMTGVVIGIGHIG